MKYVTITTESKATVHDADFPSLDEMQEIVGGYIEGVTVGINGEPCRMYVNEEGLIKNLPTNPAGQLMYGGEIRGDIIVFGPLDYSNMDPEEGPIEGPLSEYNLNTLKVLVTRVCGGEWVEA